MKKFISVFFSLALTVSLLSSSAEASVLVSFKSGRIIQQESTVPPFNGINVGGPFNVIVKLGQKEEIRIEGDKEIVKRIETKVESSILRIGFKERKMSWNWSNDGGQKVKIYVTVKSLKSISVSGSGKVVVQGTVKGDSLASVVSGSGNLTVDADVKSYTAVISGSGAITTSGSANSTEVTVSGSGSFRGKDLIADEAEVRISGSGSATLHAENHLEAVLSGSGNIRYSGDPHVDVTKSGSGSVSKL